MSIGFPIHIVLSIVIVMVAVGIGAWLILSSGLARAHAAPAALRNWRLGSGLILGLWFAVRLALALTAPDGHFQGADFLVPTLVIALSVGSSLPFVSPLFRRLLQAVPEGWLIGLHTLRVGGATFLALLDINRLPAGFALPAGYGDITVGLLALVVLYALATDKPYARNLAMIWNVLGLLDFVVALATGQAFIGAFATPLAQSGVSLSYLNYVFLIPSFGVPIFALLHIYSLYQLASPKQQQVEAQRELKAEASSVSA